MIINMKREGIALIVVSQIMACTNRVVTLPNSYNGQGGRKDLIEMVDTKALPLDSISSPMPVYMQLYKNGNSNILTFLNQYNSCIYYYDYSNCTYLYKKSFNLQGKNKIQKPVAYCIINQDSICILDAAKMSVTLFRSSDKKIIRSISLKGKGEKDWPLKFPQYQLTTANPIVLYKDSILFPGQMFWSILPEMINETNIFVSANYITGQVNYYHHYPSEIYEGVNWEGGLYTSVNSAIIADTIIYSFPPSHNLYITNISSSMYKIIFGGSQFAKTNNSIDYPISKSTPIEMIMDHNLKQDTYGPIIYDPYRRVFYRFVSHRLYNVSPTTSFRNKEISIIILDDRWNYLGEKNIGLGMSWNINNSFVTEEGLNIEYYDSDNSDEDFMYFSIFKLTDNE